MERFGKVPAQTRSGVSAKGKSKPVLFNLRKSIPRTKKAGRNLSHLSLISQEAQVIDDAVVQLLIILLFTVEEEEGVYKQRQISKERDVEGPVLFKYVFIYVEEICEVRIHLSNIPSAQKHGDTVSGAEIASTDTHALANGCANVPPPHVFTPFPLLKLRREWDRGPSLIH